MRRSQFYMVILCFSVHLFWTVAAQGTSVSDRTPEQEATKQTEKMQKELRLSTEQAREVYDIHLKYAKERKQSNSRVDAINRIKKKNEELSRVLDERQMDMLQSKRGQAQSVDVGGERRSVRTDAKMRASSSLQRDADSRQPNRPVRTGADSRFPLKNSSERNVTFRPNDRPVRAEPRSVRPPANTRRATEINPKETPTAPTKVAPKTDSITRSAASRPVRQSGSKR